MSASGKDFDAASLASDASLLSKKDQSSASGSRSNKRSFLSRLSGSAKMPTSSNTASSIEEVDGKQQSGAVEDLYNKYPTLGTGTRLT